MKNPLIKWFFYWTIAMAVAVFLFWAFGPKGKQIDLEEINFSTTESSALYFKNMRAYFYDKEEEEKSGYEIYRIGSRQESNSKLHFMIVHNWRMNEAYIMVESDLGEADLTSMLLISKGEKTDSISLSGGDAESNYIFAARLFEAIDRGAKINRFYNGEEIQFTEQETKSIKKSLKDYFKLVGKLR